MRLFLDCEFNEYQGALISMALVAEAMPEESWYGVLHCPHPKSWVKEHVMPILGKAPVSMAEMQISLHEWLSQYDEIHVIAGWPEDIAHFCNALITGPGTRIDTPPLTLEVIRIDADSAMPHNAYYDALGVRDEILSRG